MVLDSLRRPSLPHGLRRFIEFHAAAPGGRSRISVSPVGRGAGRRIRGDEVDGGGRIAAFFGEAERSPPTVEAMRVEPPVLERRHRRQRQVPRGLDGGLYLQLAGLKTILEPDRRPRISAGEVIPRAISEKKVFGYSFDGYWRGYRDDPQLLRSQPRPDPAAAQVQFLRRGQADLHPCPVSARVEDPRLRGRPFDPLRGKHHQPLDDPAIRSSASARGSARTAGSDRTVVMGADFSSPARHPAERPARASGPSASAGTASSASHHRQERPDRRRRQARQRGGHPGEAETRYCIVDGIIVVPKHAVIKPGTVV